MNSALPNETKKSKVTCGDGCMDCITKPHTNSLFGSTTLEKSVLAPNLWYQGVWNQIRLSDCGKHRAKAKPSFFKMTNDKSYSLICPWHLYRYRISFTPFTKTVYWNRAIFSLAYFLLIPYLCLFFRSWFLSIYALTVILMYKVFYEGPLTKVYVWGSG